jgi:branched-chain amino acid aminotransferase
MAQSLHDVSDPRNASILINVNGELRPRAEAVVSVFDSGFMLGDGVWEGMRIHKGRAAFLDRHLDRLFEGAKAIAMDIGLSREALTKRLYETLDANKMEEGVHVRLMITRGVRRPTRRGRSTSRSTSAAPSPSLPGTRPRSRAARRFS